MIYSIERCTHIDGRLWGHGAIAVDTAPKGWRCPLCGRKARKDEGRHYYPFSVACTDCARAAVELYVEVAPIVALPTWTEGQGVFDFGEVEPHVAEAEPA